MRLSLGFLLISLSLAACRCEPPPVDKGLGEINIVYELDGFMVERANGVYDFRGVAMGVSRTLKVVIKNRGPGPLELVSLERTSGDDVFTIAFEPRTLGASESVELTATFPAPVSNDVQKPFNAHFTLTAANTEVGKETSDIELKGIAVKAECALPDTIDFGGVTVGQTETRSVHLQNLTSRDEQGELGDPTSSNGDHNAFRYGPGWGAGPLLMAPGVEKDVTFRFTPTQTQTYSALVTLKAASYCASVTVKLVGSGVTAAVDCAPLDFAFLPVGLMRSQDTTLTNYALQDVTVSGLASTTNDYVAGAPSVTVPKAQRVMQNGGLVLQPGTATLKVDFKPTKIGVLASSVRGTSNLAQQPMVTCAVTGQGGGPDIELKPSGTMDVGAIPYFGNTDPFFVTRKMTIQNLGVLPSPRDPRANLKLGQGGAPPPYFRVTPKNADSKLTEICVGVYDPSKTDPLQRCTNAPSMAYDPALGLEATGTSALLDVPIRITPEAANKSMEWDIEVFSNDPDEPVVTLNVKAHSVVLPPCTFQVVPANLQFGLVSPPSVKNLSFAIRNLSPTDSCLITHLAMAPAADATFSLPNGEVDQYTLAPSAELVVPVRATASGLATTTLRSALGAVRFGISSPLIPQSDVQLTASIGLGCLTVSPSELDFGTVKRNCDSSRRVFNVYNTCTTPVTITGWSISPSSPEFTLDGATTLTMGGSIPAGEMMPRTFGLKYGPVDLGVDRGTFSLDYTQNGGTAVKQVVTLTGTGDDLGLNVDTFAQDPRPKADILWIVDSSCSMYDKQQLLSMNFASVISYASTVVPGGIDYQMGVIDSDPRTATGGKLIGDATNPKVLRAGMTNVEPLFRSKVRVGLAGSGDEQFADLAVRALTAPLVNVENAGFLRPDAILAVIAVTDAGDQSQLPTSVVEGLLRNVKGAQRPQLFTYNVIGPFGASSPPGCEYDPYYDPVLHNYLVAAFDGEKGEICDQNWVTTLDRIGKKAFGYRDRFFLSSQPDLTQMPAFVVKLNGILMPEVDMTGGTVWQYEAPTNSMKFASAYVPEPGQTLTIQYKVLCN